MKKAAQGRGPLHDWADYTFQYQGRGTFLGYSYVYVNAFCSHTGTTLQTEWVHVMDGGACFFQFRYDPTSKHIYDLTVNGVG